MSRDSQINDLIIQIMARDVEWSFALGRKLGHKLPTKYAIGFSCLGRVDLDKQGEHLRYRLRVDDVENVFTVYVPYMNGLVTMQKVDELWKAAVKRFHTEAAAMVHRYLNKYPQCFTGEPLRALAELNQALTNPISEEKLSASVRDLTANAKFSSIERR